MLTGVRILLPVATGLTCLLHVTVQKKLDSALINLSLIVPLLNCSVRSLLLLQLVAVNKTSWLFCKKVKYA